MKISLGIDASYTRTGMVWVDEQGLLEYCALSFPQGPQRLLQASRALRAKLALMPKSDVVTMERASGLAGPVLNQLQGVIILVLQGMGHQFDPKKNLVAPQTWKKWLTGYGRADKSDITFDLEGKYKISFEKDPGNDLADAAGIALWALHGKSK